ncbi:MAG TPA: hypothetical protein VIO32_06470 [Candidatus Baltobacteraceae bacterium]
MKLATIALSALFFLPVTIGQAAAAQTQTLRGTVVNYLSSAGIGGGLVANNPDTGGIMVSSKNAGIYTHGSSQLVQPLGLKAHGTLYLLDVSSKNGNVVSKLARDQGKTISVKGHTVQQNGAAVFVVNSIG